jgi:hypothetical protein
MTAPELPGKTDMSVENYPSRSIRNRKAVLGAQSCGCYFCRSTFRSADVTEWTDDGETAICPHCAIDSVLPGVINPELLSAGHERWFGTALRAHARRSSEKESQ